MSDDDDEQPPKTLLQPISTLPNPISTTTVLTSGLPETLTSKRPYRITFLSRDEEIRYTEKLRSNCQDYDGDPDTLMTWLNATNTFLVRDGYPETDHPFIIRHLLVGEALDYYLAHEDLIFNFYDLRKLFLRKHNTLASLRTLPTLDSVPIAPLTSNPSILTSTHLPPVTTTSGSNNPLAATNFSFAQSLEDLTQHDIRKTIIEDLHRNTAKFTGEHRQDVVKWLKALELKFDVAEIPSTKKFQLISQLLEKGALDWFQENKPKFGYSWENFVSQFKKTFDSPNRSRIAMQKLQGYTQSPQQDVRSFCSEMRKLFKEADPQMSSSMKLELLLAKITPTYRLDLLKQKPNDPEEFEVMAKDLEHTYLVYDAIHQNAQTNLGSDIASEAPAADIITSDPALYPLPTSYRNQSSSSAAATVNRPRVVPTFSYGSGRPSLNASRGVRHYPRPAFNHGPRYDRYNSSYGGRQNVSSQPSRSYPREHAAPIVSAIPSLMDSPVSEPTLLPSETLTVNKSSIVICQLCGESGHSARLCPF